VIDPQDPLPESQFFWRRLFSYLACLILLGLLAFIVTRIEGDPELATIAKWLIGLIALLMTYYMIAPSAEQLARIIQAARVMRASVEQTGRVEGMPPPVGSAQQPDREIV